MMTHLPHMCSGGLKSKSVEETIALGQAFGKSLAGNEVVCLYGELGAGKTHFAKGVVSGIAGCDPDEISSPTFVYMQPYEGVYHFDLYRMSGKEAFLAMGFDELFHADGVCCIEWAERIEEILPKDAIRVTLKVTGENTREISGLTER